MTKRALTTLLTGLCMFLAAGGAAPAMADDEGESIHRRIMINVETDTDGENETRRIFIDADGNRTEVGEGHVWVGHHGEGPGAFAFSFGGAHGFLGVTLTELTPELRVHLGGPEDAGVLVSRVIEGSPAARADLRVGDIISRVGDVDTPSTWSLKKEIMSQQDGDVAMLEVWRDGQVQQIEAAIEVRESPGMGFSTRSLHCAEGEDCGDLMTVIELDCDGDDCPHEAWATETCDESPCTIEIECDDGGCTCESNGEPIDCPEHVGRLHD